MKRPDPTLEEILQAIPQHRTLWKHLGIDVLRCRNRTLSEVCRQHDLDPSTTARLLDALRETPPTAPAVILELLPPDELCAHIERGQHARLRAEMARLERSTRRAARVPGGPHLRKIRTAFAAFRSHFAAHLADECALLFPRLRRSRRHTTVPDHTLVRSRLNRWSREHCEMDDALVDLETLANTEAARNTPSSVAAEIAASIARLHQIVQEQIFIENRILFPQVRAQRAVP